MRGRTDPLASEPWQTSAIGPAVLPTLQEREAERPTLATLGGGLGRSLLELQEGGNRRESFRAPEGFLSSFIK